MPLNVALVDLQASHNYYLTLTTLAYPWVTLPTISNTLKRLPNDTYNL
jgi:hypothetical protein